MLEDRVATALEGVRLPALVVTDLPLGQVPAETTVIDTATPKPDEHFRTVLLAAEGPDDLRAVVSRLPALGWARVVCVVLADHDRALTFRPDPSSAPPTEVEARVGWTRVMFAERLEALPVLRAFARALAPGGPRGHGGVRVGRPGAGFDDAATTVPPDVVVRPPAPPVVSEATGRAPAVVEALPPAVDEGVYAAPFRRAWSRPVVDLPAGARLSPALVRDLAGVQGVRVASDADPLLRAGLALSGLPVLDAGSDADVLDDALAREERWVGQWRAALVEHSLLARRLELAVTARVRAVDHPSVSVVLRARDHDRLSHALVQLTRQRVVLPGAAVELVVVADGVEADPDLVEAAAELGGFTFSERATGDLVLTLDDDLWLGPDVVTDLLLARHHSGADLVGLPDDLCYLEADDATVRLGGSPSVAGGTVLVERGLYRELGEPAGAELVARVVAGGGRVHLGHGLGHVRRVGPGEVVDPDAVTARWSGFRPSALLELS